MSIVALKRKTKVLHQRGMSGKTTQNQNTWVFRGPHGDQPVAQQQFNEGNQVNGFSLNGSTRGNSYIGRDCKMSQQGTSFRGEYPVGYGGTGGQYRQAEPVLNMGPGRVAIRGTQHEYVRPSTLDTAGMLRTRFKWIHSGTYPNYWVQPGTGGSLVDNGSSGAYTRSLSIAANNVYSINGGGGRRGSYPATQTEAQNRVSDGCANSTYVKNTHAPLTAGEQIARVQRPCSVQTDAQRPFPYRVASGNTTNSFGVNCSCGGTAVLRSPYDPAPK